MGQSVITPVAPSLPASSPAATISGFLFPLFFLALRAVLPLLLVSLDAIERFGNLGHLL